MWALRFFPLLCYYAMLTVAATKTKPIGNDDDCQFRIIVNSASTAAPIGLLPKMAEFCHTSNRSLLVRQCRCALLQLYFISSATGWQSVVSGWWSVGNKGCRALGGSLQKDKGLFNTSFSASNTFGFSGTNLIIFRFFIGSCKVSGKINSNQYLSK